MIPLNPSFLIAAATSFVGLGEDGGDNRGQMVEMFLRQVRQPAGQPWCAAFVYHVGYWSHFDHREGKSSWPLPATASCYELGRYAKALQVLRKVPAEGDVFLLYSPKLKRFAHTGVVVSVDQCIGSAKDAVYVCTTLEGNTNEDGSREGRMTLRKTRRFSPANGDQFIHWPDVAARTQAA